MVSLNLVKLSVKINYLEEISERVRLFLFSTRGH